mgnify:FL=1|jgi:hypothetical protein|tara:strand:+ start:537 stop:737 length:201 start_codon:yes stop_codon:yes gene_type:complete
MGENNNVIDFIAYKMRNLIEDLAKANRLDYADAMQYALDAYLLGEVDIGFIEGWPYVIDIPEDINL